MAVRWVALLVLLYFLSTSSLCAAPLPKKDQIPGPPVEVVLATLGKDHLGKEVRALGRLLKEYPQIRYSLWNSEFDRGGLDGSFDLIWKAKGIDLCVRTKGGVRMVCLYNACPEGNRRYEGELPSKLSFDDDLAKVEEKLGKPEKVTELPAREIVGSEKELEETWFYYPKKGIEVLLRRPVGGKWSIYCLKVTPPKE